MNIYERGQNLGEGTWGIVFEATRKTDGRKVGVKRIKCKDPKDGVVWTALREVKYLQELHHPNIIELIDVYIADSALHLVFEFCPLDLEKIIKAKKEIYISPSDVKSYMNMLLQGLAHCHNHFILHRDLKPSNLLIATNGQLRLADFGLAREHGSPNRSMSNEVVTRWYRAPELMFGARRYSAAIDMWAIGCIFAELMLRVPLFAGNTDTDTEQLGKIFNALGTPTPATWPAATSLPCYLEFEPREPLDLSPLFMSQPSSAQPLLLAMLTLDPMKRLSATKALEHPYFSTLPEATPPENLPTSLESSNVNHGSGAISNKRMKIER